MKGLIKLFFFLLCSMTAFAQTGIIKGKIVNALTNEALPFATVQVVNTTKGAQTDENGLYEITELNAKLYAIKVTFVGFKDLEQENVFLNLNQKTNLKIALVSASSQLESDPIYFTARISTRTWSGSGRRGPCGRRESSSPAPCVHRREARSSPCGRRPRS